VKSAPLPQLDVSAYLERIGYRGSLLPNAETLRALHRAHMLSVPFENLDIGWKRKIVIDREAFLRKVVAERRGGFCYELNGAFSALLEAMGFNVTMLSARAPTAIGSDGPEYDHLALRVDLEEPWLADVGFGDSFIEPLRLQLGVAQSDGRQRFRIVQLQDALKLETLEAAGNWRTEYLFSLVPRQLEEFSAMCHFHQTSPDSPFTRKRVCSRATSDGRITLSDMKLIITAGGTRKERLLNSEEEWWEALEQNFQITRQRNPQQG
jgi:N-hydroxyarylamine O-acetyltransferase